MIVDNGQLLKLDNGQLTVYSVGKEDNGQN